MNPVPEGNCLSLNVNEEDNSIDISLALEVASYFGLTEQESEAAVTEICHTVQENWEKIAQKHGLNRGAVERMRGAFSAKENQI